MPSDAETLGTPRRILCVALSSAVLTASLYFLWQCYEQPNKWPGLELRSAIRRDGSHTNALEELHYALETMQNHYFQVWLGKWTTSIDWTGAVLGTFVSASLYSLTRSMDYLLPSGRPSGTPLGMSQSSQTVLGLEGQKVENEINRYFSQSIAYYFGEDAFSIRLEAYDDMLWVVLGWLESIKFVGEHTEAHYPAAAHRDGRLWYGNQFVPGFAHRARIFYDLARQGYDTTLCGGGMLWNPRLEPYKNAITNQLWISASVSMYLYFPGDQNASPFSQGREQDAGVEGQGQATETRNRPHDPMFLQNAIRTYNWLKSSNMTNAKGLYVDGFHIAGWSSNGSMGTGNCDVRDEMVYTYNQGVLLSGLRGLWESTGKIGYLEDGHELVRNVIKATGWRTSSERSPAWSGLGRNGIMEELCDASASCSQNGQTFKGIFFHHLTTFCKPLPREALIPGKTHAAGPAELTLHAQSCKEYAAWVIWNARAALRTRDEQGRFGMWWGAPSGNETDLTVMLPPGAQDYRNRGLGPEEIWGRGWQEGLSLTPPGPSDGAAAPNRESPGHPAGDQGLRVDLKSRSLLAEGGKTDLNDRGRGRTVETQGGGVAVLRAMWEFIHLYDA